MSQREEVGVGDYVNDVKVKMLTGLCTNKTRQFSADWLAASMSWPAGGLCASGEPANSIHL